MSIFLSFVVIILIYFMVQNKKQLEQDKKQLEQDYALKIQKQKEECIQELDKCKKIELKKIEIFKKDELRKLESKKKEIETIKFEFNKGFLHGRKWLSELIAESETSIDNAKEAVLRIKKNPAIKAADTIKQIKSEKQKLLSEIKFLQYQLQSYKEYFPFLDEYEDLILQEACDFRNDFTQDDIKNIDPIHKYLPLDEYNALTPSQRNQLALDRYLSSNLDNYSIGRLYEMYLGFVYTNKGWDVQYHGIQKQKQDLGRDLICEKDNTIHIVQAKCWSHDKLIHEKHIFQLFGTTFEYKENHQHNTRKEIIPVFITTTTLSDVARSAADLLGIKYRENFELQKKFPMIKCNINKATGEKIYHLPFDQQYNRTVITKKDGEFYALTVAEAEEKGFRRAFRHYTS
ncbi:MAG: hypothetical protein NC124_19565 [Clostridium sp.]|nr:hypothetical protein [Clostridium sp.]